MRLSGQSGPTSHTSLSRLYTYVEELSLISYAVSMELVILVRALRIGVPFGFLVRLSSWEGALRVQPPENISSTVLATCETICKAEDRF